MLFYSMFLLATTGDVCCLVVFLLATGGLLFGSVSACSFRRICCLVVFLLATTGDI